LENENSNPQEIVEKISR
jgi:serine/threonine protein phosphatase PrpC